MRFVCLVLIALGAAAAPVIAQESATFHAAPDAVDNRECSPVRPCSPQGAFQMCRKQQREECHVLLADGIYRTPRINVFYFRTAYFSGNCSNPNAVVLLATDPNTSLFQAQDHSIGVLECVSLRSETQATTGILARQIAIVDYRSIDFGEMPGGTHVSAVAGSFASCVGPNTISGGAHVHAASGKMSELNMGCTWHLPAPVSFDFFLNAIDFSVINAQAATYVGEASESTGVKCNSWRATVYAQFEKLPGEKTGNCQNEWR